jgi:hypothetical protein
MNKNTQSGFIIPLIIGIVVVLLAGGAYVAYKNEKGQEKTAAQTASQVAALNDQASTTGDGAGMSSTTTIDNVRTNATGASTTTQPAPVITSINPSSITIGSIVTISGTNLNGFEGETNVTLTNQNGQSGVIEANSYIPAGATTLKITIPASICTVSTGLSGKPCPSYLSITPGTYSVSVSPWGVTSNSVPLVVTSTWLIYKFGSSQISYPKDLSVKSVTSQGSPYFTFPQSYMGSNLVGASISDLELADNRLPAGQTIVINGISWIRSDNTMPISPGMDKGEFDNYSRQVSYEFCEEGCSEMLLTIASSDQASLNSIASQNIIEVFEQMMSTYKYPITIN